MAGRLPVAQLLADLTRFFVGRNKRRVRFGNSCLTRRRFTNRAFCQLELELSAFAVDLLSAARPSLKPGVRYAAVKSFLWKAANAGHERWQLRQARPVLASAGVSPPMDRLRCPSRKVASRTKGGQADWLERNVRHQQMESHRPGPR